MKKLIIVGSIILLTSITNFSQTPSFQNGNKNLDLGIALGIYATEGKNLDNGDFEEGGAASYLVPLSFEYGILNWLGVGAFFQYSHYLQNQDSIQLSGVNWDANSFDLGLKANLHFIRTPHTDMFVGSSFGISPAKYQQNDVNRTVFKDIGTVLSFYLQSRFMIGQNVAVSIYGSSMMFNYSSGVISNNLGEAVDFSLKLKGVNFGVALGWKF